MNNVSRTFVAFCVVSFIIANSIKEVVDPIKPATVMVFEFVYRPVFENNPNLTCWHIN